VDVAVNYLNGHESVKGAIRVDAAGVGMLFGKKRSGGYPWDQVRRISFDDPGRTKANGAAIAMFGVLGMAARRPFTYVTVSVLDADLHFENEWPIVNWRSWAFRLVEEIPWAAGRILVDGQVVGLSPQQPQPAAPTGPSPLDQLRQLGELRDAGVITADEFESKKAELLSRM
jgi:hypothetical protein